MDKCSTCHLKATLHYCPVVKFNTIMPPFPIKGAFIIVYIRVTMMIIIVQYHVVSISYSQHVTLLELKMKHSFRKTQNFFEKRKMY